MGLPSTGAMIKPITDGLLARNITNANMPINSALVLAILQILDTTLRDGQFLFALRFFCRIPADHAATKSTDAPPNATNPNENDS